MLLTGRILVYLGCLVLHLLGHTWLGLHWLTAHTRFIAVVVQVGHTIAKSTGCLVLRLLNHTRLGLHLLATDNRTVAVDIQYVSHINTQ